MEDLESNKTSDEIINELFSSLNVPLSPKADEEHESKEAADDVSTINVDPSDNSDEESDSKSSGSEEGRKDEVQEIVQSCEEIEKVEKHRSSKKKKKEKKKKKKKKKKEESGSKHKHKKKKKKDADNEYNGRLEGDSTTEAKEKEKKQDEEVTRVEEKVKSPTPEVKEVEKLPSHPESPKGPEKVTKGVETENKLKRKLAVETDVREESVRKHRKTDHTRSSRSQSPSKSHSLSKSSRRSRSRSGGRGHGRHSRSRSRSKPHSYSRSHSKTHRKSRSRSPFASDRHRRKRSSRSYSRSRSPKSYKRRRSSRSRSKSPSRRSSSSRRSGSRSKSRTKSSYSREVCDLLDRARERASKTDVLKTPSMTNIDVSSIPTPGSIAPRNQGTLGELIALDSIPLPIPQPAAPDPSSIPLPQPLNQSDESSKRDGHKSMNGIGLDLENIPVPAPSNKDQDNNKATDAGKAKQDEGAEKKAKTIIIKSLKDSLVFQQAQEEAERMAKERAKLEEEDEEEDRDSGIKEEEEEGTLGESVTAGEGALEEEEEDEGKDSVSDDPRDRADGEEVRGELQEFDIAKVLKETRERLEKKEEVAQDHEKVEVEEKKEDEVNGMEEGEIASEEEEAPEKVQTKSHKKKSKKDRDKHKEKRKSRKDKEKSKEEKKKKKRDKDRSKSRSRDRGKSRSGSRTREKGRTRSRSRTREKGRSRSRSRTRSRDRHKSRRRSSHSRDRSSRAHHRSRSRSRSRSKSHSHRKRENANDFRDKVTRKRLLEIARRNAVYLMQNGCLPPSVEQEQLVKIKAGGKSVEELTNFCKQLVATGNYSDVDLTDPSMSSGDDNENSDKPFSSTRHPFSVRDTKPILMNIRNAPMLPTKTNAERLADQAKLREQFPVSSGSHHRTKGEQTTTEGKLLTESSWVPVSPKEKKAEDKVFPEPEPVQQSVDISQIVSTRLSAMRRLQDNPHDMEAIKTLHNVQKEMQNWALSKQEPGQFTGSTGVKVLSQEELSAGHQAWARKIPSCQVLRGAGLGGTSADVNPVAVVGRNTHEASGTTRDQEGDFALSIMIVQNR